MPLPESGFDDETTGAAPAAPVATLDRPKGGRPSRDRPEADRAPLDVPPVAPPTREPTMAEVLAELARVKSDNENLTKLAVEALTRKANAPAVDAPVVELATRKLLFTGQRMETQNNATFIVDDTRPGPNGEGPIHVCGRGGHPVVFKGSADDIRVHAMIHESFGDWLITNDGPTDQYGRVTTPRYRWDD